jgi:hypothetical protein
MASWTFPVTVLSVQWNSVWEGSGLSSIQNGYRNRKRPGYMVGALEKYWKECWLSSSLTFILWQRATEVSQTLSSRDIETRTRQKTLRPVF